jgi:hypothetical protein
MPWTCDCCERRAVADIAVCQQLFKRHAASGNSEVVLVAMLLAGVVSRGYWY